MGPPPENLRTNQWSLMPNVLFDLGTLNHKIGEVKQQPKNSYKRGETVKVIFQAANPRNSNQRKHCFLNVDKKQSHGKWKEYVKDSAWETKFIWISDSILSPYSEAHIEWNISNVTETGIYRIRHN